MPADRYTWSRLNKFQLSKYAEYLVKMEFVVLGCDVFTVEVDDHGIDFVVRTPEGNHYDIQVKSFRPQTNYVGLEWIHPSLFLALVQCIDDKPPVLFLVQTEPNPMFEQRYYTHQGKRVFEWGLALSKKNLVVLAKEYGFSAVVTRLIGSGNGKIE
jgi:hypothetical protein